MDSFSLLAAAAEAAHRDGYQVAVLARRSDTSQLSFRFDGINGKTRLVLKQIFEEISCTYADDFTEFDPNISILRSVPKANPLSSPSHEQQSLTRDELFLEIFKLLNVTMSLLDAKASNTVLTECNKVQNSQGDSLSQSMPASESAECEPQTDCNSFYGEDANENTASRVNSPLPAQQEEVLEDEVADNALTEVDLMENCVYLQEDSFTSSAAHLPTVNVCSSVSIPAKKKKRKKRALQREISPKHRIKLKIHQCTKCSYATASSSILKRHQKAVHEKVRSHQCEHCDSAFSRKHHLQRHISNIHEKTQPPLCEDPGFLDKGDAHTEDWTEDCEYIPEDPFKPTAFQLPTVDDSSSASTPACKKKKVHIAIKHHYCLQCSYIATSSGTLKRHQKSVHEKVRSHQCEHCDSAFSRNHHLQRHISYVHEKKVPEKKMRDHQCEHCDSAFSRKQHLERHISNIHEKTRAHLCDECGKSYSVLSYLKRHKRQHTGDKIRCSICSFSTIYEKNMREHILVKHRTEDTTGLLHNCRECEYITARADNLVQHVDKVHKKLRPHACELCDYKSYTQNELNKHLVKVHNQSVSDDGEQIKCDQCEYVALHSYHLKRHVNSVHEKSTMYPCELCSYTSSRKDNLMTHIRKKHNKWLENRLQGKAMA